MARVNKILNENTVVPLGLVFGFLISALPAVFFVFSLSEKVNALEKSQTKYETSYEQIRVDINDIKNNIVEIKTEIKYLKK